MSIEAMKQALEALAASITVESGPSHRSAMFALRKAIEQAEKQEAASRKFTAEDIARIFDVPPVSIVSADLMATFVNCRSVFLACLVDCKYESPKYQAIQKRIDDINEWIEWLKKTENKAIVDSTQDIDWQSLALDKIEKIEKLKNREWVGLTENEAMQIRMDTPFNLFMTTNEYAAAVQLATERKLKEKNHEPN